MLVGIILTGTFLRPLLHIPDERFHVDMVRRATDGSGWPAPKSVTLAPEVTAGARLSLQDVRDPDLALPPRTPGVVPECRRSAPIPDCDAKPTFDELAEQYASYRSPTNRMTQHPPAYYLVTGGTVGVATTLTLRTIPYDGQVWLYRLVSLALVAPIALLLHATARELRLSPAMQATAAVLPALVVGLTLRNAPIVNNDNLLMPLMFGVTYLLARMHRRGAERASIIGLGVLLGVSLITKGTSMLAVPMVPISLWLLGSRSLRDRSHALATVRHTAVVAATAFVAGGWWPVRNMVLYGTPQPGGIRFPTATEPFDTSFVAWLGRWGNNIVATGLGRPADLLLASPALLVITVVVVGGAVVLGARELGPRLALALNLPLAFTFLGWTAHAYRGFLRHGLMSSANARYYYPLLAGLVIVLVAAMARLSRTTRIPERAWLVTALAFAGAATAVEARALLRSMWSDTTSALDGLMTMTAWAPAPVGLLYLGVALAMVGAAVVLLPTAADDHARDVTQPVDSQHAPSRI